MGRQSWTAIKWTAIRRGGIIRLTFRMMADLLYVYCEEGVLLAELRGGQVGRFYGADSAESDRTFASSVIFARVILRRLADCSCRYCGIA
jgi:hypothetical protein